MTDLPSNTSVDPRLRDYLDAELERAERDFPALARPALRPARRRLAVGLAVAVVVVVVVVVGPRLLPAPSGGSGATPIGTEPSTSAPPCDGHEDRGVLPAWARGGFSDPEPSMPHVVSLSGEITAILFGDPLSSPPSPERSNKILWVLRTGLGSALTISAQRMDGTSPVGGPVERRLEQFPGPSTVDLPEPGCWRLTLTWADRTDTLDLEYGPPG
jgi:hypothetical protein